MYLIHGYHSELRLYHAVFPPGYLHDVYHLGWPTAQLPLQKTRAYEMLVPRDRVDFFDVVVALVRKVVNGDVRTGYFGLSLSSPMQGGVAEGEGETQVCALLFFRGVDGRVFRRQVRMRSICLMSSRNKKKRKKKKTGKMMMRGRRKKGRRRRKRRRWIQTRCARQNDIRQRRFNRVPMRIDLTLQFQCNLWRQHQ
jgi:hypothetical protein